MKSLTARPVKSGSKRKGSSSLYDCPPFGEMMKSKVLTVLVCALCAAANAAPVIDGVFDSSEGYTVGYNLNLNVERAGLAPDQAQIWYYQDTLTNDLSVALVLPLSLVDNSYGKNQIGWGKHVAPSGKNHNFKDLTGSDSAEFKIYDQENNNLLHLELDYISASGNKYASLGVTAGDGQMHYGSSDYVTEWGTSLDYNFNVLGHKLTNYSPSSNSDYNVDDPEYSDWVFDVIYEFKIDGALFDDLEFGKVDASLIHASPNKIGKNKIYTEQTIPVPEPATLAILGLGAMILNKNTKRRRNSIN